MNGKLTFPEDIKALKKLSLEELQAWIASQDPRSLIYMSETKEYRSFIFWSYLVPLKLKRMLYKVKNLWK